MAEKRRFELPQDCSGHLSRVLPYQLGDFSEWKRVEESNPKAFNPCAVFRTVYPHGCYPPKLKVSRSEFQVSSELNSKLGTLNSKLMVAVLGVEPRRSANQANMLLYIIRPQNMELSQRLELCYSIYRTDASPSMLGKQFGAGGKNRTPEYEFCRLAPFHLATPAIDGAPTES